MKKKSIIYVCTGIVCVLILILAHYLNKRPITDSGEIEIIDEVAIPEGIPGTDLIGNNGNESKDFEVINDEPNTSEYSSNFISVNGTKFVDAYGEEYNIEAMGIPHTWADKNNCTADEEGLRDIARLGFNTIHLWVHYNDFIDENGNKVDNGWNYIDDNIRIARENNLRIILKMDSWPESNISRMNMWKSEELMNLFINLWIDIASRYSNESTIIGFSCINEPDLPNISGVDKVYYSFLDKLCKDIRTNDPNHIIFIEQAIIYGVGEVGVYIPSEENISYEFHMYQPMFYTHQPTYYNIQKNVINECSYPDESIVILDGKRSNLYKNDNEYPTNEAPMQYNTNKGGWQELRYGYFNLSECDAFTWSMRCDNLGVGGNLYADDVIISLYDENKQPVRKIILSFDKEIIPFADGTENPNAVYCITDGFTNQGCIRLFDTLGVTSITSDIKTQYTKVYENEHYATISAMIKIENYSKDIFGYLNLTGIQCENVNTFNKDYLYHCINEYIQKSEELDVPLYMGEFGLVYSAYFDEHGGEKYISDLIDICKENEISFSYHSYWNAAFGLYYNHLRKDVVPNLSNVFIGKLK